MGRSKRTIFPKFNSVRRVDFGDERLVGLRDGRSLGNFNDLSDLGTKYLNQVVLAIEIETETLALSTARYRFKATKNFLEFIRVTESDEAKRIRSCIQRFSMHELDVTTAVAIEEKYRTHLCKNKIRGSRPLALGIDSINMALRNLAARNLWPHTLRLKREKKDITSTATRPTMLESLGQTSKVLSRISQPSEETRKSEALEGLRKLKINIPENNKLLRSALLAGERACLEKLRHAAGKIFEREYLPWAHMKAIVDIETNVSGLDVKEWIDAALGFSVQDVRNPPFERETAALFPCSEVGLARFLIAVKATYLSGDQSIYWKIASDTRNDFSLFLRNAANRVLPVVAKLRPHAPPTLDSWRGLIGPTNLCSASVMTLLMAETGMNLTPTLILPWNQVKATDDPNWISIATWKDRAGGTLIIEELELSRPGEQISAGRALMNLKEMSADHASLVEATDNEKLHSFSRAGGFVGEALKPFLKIQTIPTFHINFKSIVAIAFGDKTKICPSSLRPSLLTTLRGESRCLGTAQLMANHKSRETTYRNYAGNSRTVFRIEHLDDIRLFQERLETIALVNLTPTSAGELPTVLKENLEDAVRTGLGTLCLQKRFEPEESGKCTSIQDCPNCKSVTISTTVNDLADLLSFQQHLEANREWLETFREEAWKTRWLYWALLAEEVIRRGKRSSWAGNLQKAQAIVAARPKLELPPLW